MASQDPFEELLENELQNTRRLLAEEHHRAVQRLAAKANALEGENARLRKQYAKLLFGDAEAQRTPAAPVPQLGRRMSYDGAPSVAGGGVGTRIVQTINDGISSMRPRRMSFGGVAGTSASDAVAHAHTEPSQQQQGTGADNVMAVVPVQLTFPGQPSGNEGGQGRRMSAPTLATPASGTRPSGNGELGKISRASTSSVGASVCPPTTNAPGAACASGRQSRESVQQDDSGCLSKASEVGLSTTTASTKEPDFPNAVQSNCDKNDVVSSRFSSEMDEAAVVPIESNSRRQSAASRESGKSAKSPAKSSSSSAQSDTDSSSGLSEDYEEKTGWYSERGSTGRRAVSGPERGSDRTPTADDQAGSFRVHEAWTNAQARIQFLEIARRNNRRKCSIVNPAGTVTNLSEVLGQGANEDGEDDEDPTWLDKKMERFIVHPSSAKRLVWEVLGVSLVIYDIIVIPLQYIDPRSSSSVSFMSWFTRLFWTADIFFSVLTGFVSQDAQGMTQLRPSKVMKRYLKSRFPLDAVIVGSDWVEEIVGDSGLSLTGALRVARVFRLARLAKARNLTDYVLNNIRSEGKMIGGYVFMLVIALLALIHVMACIWSGVRSSDWGGAGDMGQLEWERDAGERDSSEYLERYVECFHYVLALFVGEHVSLPANLAQKIFTVVVLIFAFVVSASFVGSLTTSMTRLQIIASQRSAQFAALNRYLSDCRISARLSMRVQRNARHALNERIRNTHESKVELLTLISEPLRSEIHYEVHAPLLTRHPFFFLYNARNPAGVRQICHHTVSTLHLSRGDVLFSEFEVPAAPKMFFINSGRLAYSQGIVAHHKVFAKQWLSEAALWTTWAHRGLIQASVECRLVTIDAHRFINIMTTFPTLHAAKYAELFVQHLAATEPLGQLSDVGEDSDRLRSLACEAFAEIDDGVEIPEGWKTPRRNSMQSVETLMSAKASAVGTHVSLSNVSTALPRVGSAVAAWFRQISNRVFGQR